MDYVGGLAFGDSNVGTGHSAHPADLDDFNNSRRTNNAIKFKSIDYSGLTISPRLLVGVAYNYLHGSAVDTRNGKVT